MEKMPGYEANVSAVMTGATGKSDEISSYLSDRSPIISKDFFSKVSISTLFLINKFRYYNLHFFIKKINKYLQIKFYFVNFTKYEN